MVVWRVSDQPVTYPEAVAWMERQVAEIETGRGEETIWLLEHPPLVTAGSSARTSDLLAPDRFPVFASGRGGQHTYHGPGQRVGYVLLDLRRRGKDVRRFVWMIEAWLIAAFAEFGLTVERREGRIGLWVPGEPGRKIAAVGLRLRKWISFHGFSVNIAPDLSHYDAIVPCGLPREQSGVASLADLGYAVTLADFDQALRQTFPRVFDQGSEKSLESRLWAKTRRSG